MEKYRDKINCAVCGKKNGSVMCHLNKAAIAKVNREKNIHTFERDQIVFYENNPAFALYCIHSGCVKLFKTRANGDRQVIRLLGPGDVIGYRPILAGDNYAASAETVMKTTICIIPRETFLATLKESPGFAMRMLSKLAEEIKLSEEHMLALVYHPVRQRAAKLLLSLIENKIGRSNQSEFDVAPLRRGEMAQIIGTSPETFSRIIREFVKKKYIKLKGQKIVVTNTRELDKIAGQE